MTSDRDRFDDHRDEGEGWREPAHLGHEPGGSGEQPPTQPPASSSPAAQDGEQPAAAWEPPGWSLPDAEPQRDAVPAGEPTAIEPPVAAPPAGGPLAAGGFFGPRQRRPGEVEQVFRYQGDLVGAQGWAFQHGWTISDGEGPEDKLLAELVATAPVRLGKDHRAASVLRGRAGTLELVAFDVLYASGRYRVPEYAVTAAPLLVPLPYLRLTPARFWKHRTGGLLQIPSGDAEFDTRWVLLATEDTPAVRRLVQDVALRALLLGSDDGDEFWTAAGHVAVIRPDGHRPELIEHHARLLGAVVGALAGI
jgi:hypothetical protein